MLFFLIFLMTKITIFHDIMVDILVSLRSTHSEFGAHLVWWIEFVNWVMKRFPWFTSIQLNFITSRQVCYIELNQTELLNFCRIPMLFRFLELPATGWVLGATALGFATRVGFCSFDFALSWLCYTDLGFAIKVSFTEFIKLACYT